MAVNETLLGKFKANFKGVIWDEQNWGGLAKRCLFAVCGNTRAVFRNSIVRNVKGNFDGAVCVFGQSKVRVVNTTVASNTATGIWVANNSSVHITSNTSITRNMNITSNARLASVQQRPQLCMGG